MLDKQTKENAGVSILVVEDSPTQAESLRHILEQNNYIVHTTVSGVAALKFLETQTPTMVITDIIMPEMDGYELCKKMKSDKILEKIPVILLTTLSDPDDVIKGLDCGADNFINKPYDKDFLLSRIDYILLNLDLRKETSTELGIEIVFAGKKQFISSNRIQILDLLLSTYENAVLKSRELEKAYIELKKANETILTLEGLIPICANCKKIRDDSGFWQQIEEYLREHSDAKFTHGICPECVKVLYPGLLDKPKS